MKQTLFIFCALILFIDFGYAQTVRNNTSFEQYSFGSYGEFLLQQKDYSADRYNNPAGAEADNRSSVGMPRIVFSFDYKLRDDIIFSTELEIEYGGTGSAMELEYEEAGEYEMEVEKAGEVVLEQIFIQKSFSPAFAVKVGHFVVPVGRLNMYHLPTEFFTTVRAEGETQLLPTTWHETGIAASGALGKWKYEVQLVNGLDANGFSQAGWVSTGYQRLFEDTKATQMAVAARVENRSLANTVLAVSGYRGNSAKNTSKPKKMEGLNGTVSVYSADAMFNNNRIIARGNVVYGNLGDSYEISAVNQTLSKNLQYSRTPVAQNALTYAMELGYDVFTHFRTSERLIPFVRYEYYNSMENTSSLMVADARYKRSIFTVGVNYYVTPTLVVKADYATRQIDGGNYRTEHTFGLSVAYATYFFRK